MLRGSAGLGGGTSPCSMRSALPGSVLMLYVVVLPIDPVTLAPTPLSSPSTVTDTDPGNGSPAPTSRGRAPMMGPFVGALGSSALSCDPGDCEPQLVPLTLQITLSNSLVIVPATLGIAAVRAPASATRP